MTDTGDQREQVRQPVVNILGEQVALGPIHGDLLPLLLKWSNDFCVQDLQGGDARPLSTESLAAYWEPHIKGLVADRVDFAIYERSSSRPIGNANLRDIDGIRRTAEFGLRIGETDCWGRGYGTEATRLVLDYAFTVLCLHNVWLQTWSYNERAIRAYRRAGFKFIGRRREAHRVGNMVYDVVLMDSLATEFEPSPNRFLHPERSLDTEPAPCSPPESLPR